MGGRKQRKKKIIDWNIKEAFVPSNHSAPARNVRKTDLGAVIFGCKHNTINECLSNQLFGLPTSHYSYIKNISPGLVLFLFNYSDRKLHGIFEAASPGQMNINSNAWVADGDDTEYTNYPAQVRIRVRQQCAPLLEKHFRPIIANNYYENYHFYFELDHDQTKKLIALFTSSSTDSNASLPHMATKQNNLPGSLPAKKQAGNGMQNWQAKGGVDHAEHYNEEGSSWDALPPPEMTNLLDPAVGLGVSAENPNQTSGLSYASVLNRNSTTFPTAPSPQPTRKWSTLFETQSDFEVTNDTEWDKEVERNYDGEVNELPHNKANGDFLQANIWEESELVATTTDVKCVQTWESELRFQANTTTNELPVNREGENHVDLRNTWEESQLIANTTDEVECDQTCESDFQANNTTDELPTNHECEEKVGFVEANMEESLLIATTTDEVECVQTMVSDSTQYVDKPSSSTQDTNEDEVEEIHEKENPSVPDTEMSSDVESLAVKLMHEVEVLKGSHMKQTLKINLLEQELNESKLEIQQLRNRLGVLERYIVDPAEVNDHRSWFADSVFIVGGYDGSSWLSTLDSYFPSHDFKNPLSSMKFVKKYSSAATFNGELYHFGGMGSHTVESFIPTKNQWVSRPPLHWKNIHVAGASINERLFVVGGGSGRQCSSEVEYLDLNIGRWLPTHSMQSKRLAPAAAELNNTLYVAGGYDGVSYLSSVERFDPREESWYKLPSMNTRKGCHSMVVLNEKLYTLGGFDGDKYVATVESFDTRMGSWVETGPMNVARGNFGAFVLGETLYAIGGLKEKNEVLDNVECFKEGSGCWEVAGLKAIGRRSQFSAIVL